MSDNRVAGGHKANLNNPNTSEESKQHSREVLGEQADDGDYETGNQSRNTGKSSNTSRSSDNSRSTDTGGKNPGNVAGGLKATLNNPNVSDEAKESAQERLEQMNQ